MPDDVAHGVLAAAGSVERVDGHGGLGSDGDGVQQLGTTGLTGPPLGRLSRVLRDGTPLVDVQVVDVGFLDAGVDQAHPAGVAPIGAQGGGHGLPEQPGAVVLLLPGDALE